MNVFSLFKDHKLTPEQILVRKASDAELERLLQDFRDKDALTIKEAIGIAVEMRMRMHEVEYHGRLDITFDKAADLQSRAYDVLFNRLKDNLR